MAHKAENSHERRKYHRVPFSETVTIHQVLESKSGNVFEVDNGSVTLSSKDISEGGMRLDQGPVATLSKLVQVNFKIRKNQILEVYAKLVWQRSGQIGIQFVVFGDEIRRHLRGYVKDKSA